MPKDVMLTPFQFGWKNELSQYEQIWIQGLFVFFICILKLLLFYIDLSTLNKRFFQFSNSFFFFVSNDFLSTCVSLHTQIEPTDDIRLQCWLFSCDTDPNKARERPTFLFLHSNAGNLSHRIPNIRDLVEKCHFNVLILSYR